MPPKLSLGVAPLLQVAQVVQVDQVHEIRQQLVQQVQQECSLCKQAISGKRQQAPNTILIEQYGLCPKCFQRVPNERASASWYRRAWRKRVKAISKEKGWGWQTQPEIKLAL